MGYGGVRWGLARQEFEKVGLLTFTVKSAETNLNHFIQAPAKQTAGSNTGIRMPKSKLTNLTI